jgi:CHAT domain-containing protein
VGYRQLAQLSITLKDYVNAEKEARKSINLLKRTLPTQHPERLLARQTLVHSYLKQQDFDAAQTLIQQNIDSLSAHTDSPLFTRTLHNQAELYIGLKQPKKALQAYQQALALHQQLLPATHPTLAIEQHALAQLQQQLSHPIQALKRATAASDILSKHQHLQHHFMHHNRHNTPYTKAIFMTQLRYTHAQTTPTHEQLDAAFKSLQQAQNPQRQQTLTHATLRFSTNKKPIQQQLRRLHRLKSNWRSLNEQRLLALSQPKTAAIHHHKQLNQQLATLDNHIKQLDQQLRQNLPHYAQLINPRPVSLKEVQALLHPHEALISIITGESDSFLFIVKQDTPAQLIRLNTHQKQLKKQLLRLRYALESTPQAVKLKQGRLPFFDLTLAATLYQQLLQPAEAALKNIKHLIIVTDDTLQNLPFATLITQAMPQTHSNRYTSAQWLIKRFSLSHLPAIHALPLLRDTQTQLSVATKNNATKNKTFIGFGDVTLNKTSSPIKLANLSRGMIANVDQLRQLPYLPDTKDELLTLAQLLKSNEDKSLYLNKRATETTIKQLSADGQLADYRYIAFASHALLAKEAKAFNAPAEAGIVMTPPKIGSTADDGYLSSSEILNLTLNAEMVILSACNTANLTEANESGLSSLSKAFFLAGTRSILASQWATHSLSSKALTTGLLQRSNQHSPAISHADALRQSMLQHLHYQPACNLLCQARDWLHIAKAPPTTPYAHPAYWAPFILIGDGLATRKPINQ